MLMGLVWVAAGTVCLYFGATFLVKGSSGLARAFGVAPAVIGLTVVAFGTSLPELVVTVTAALKGNSDIALGNVIGSNTANIGLILGAAASIRAMSVEFTLLKREVPMGMGAFLLVVLLSWDGVLGRLDGIILLAGFFGFLYYSVGVERLEGKEVKTSVGEGIDEKPKSQYANWGLSVLGLAGVLVGGHMMVEGGITVAQVLGVPAVIIGLTVVAVGTSLPELAASLVAVAKGEHDIGVGGVLGSNLFNLLGVLGVAATLDPINVPPSFFKLQYPVLALFTLGLLPIMRSDMGISRAEGAVLLTGYFVYVGILFV